MLRRLGLSVFRCSDNSLPDSCGDPMGRIYGNSKTIQMYISHNLPLLTKVVSNLTYRSGGLIPLQSASSISIRVNENVNERKELARAHFPDLHFW